MLTLIKILPKEWKYRKWLYKCDCGNEKITEVYSVNKWLTRSCGCLVRVTTSKNFSKHNMTNTKIYRVWEGIRARCNNKNHRAYSNYWGRGINCERNNFIDFYNDMYPSYWYWLELDRIDNNGNYNKENCRRVTHKANNNNRRNNSYIIIWWVKRTLQETCDMLWVKASTICVRVLRGKTRQEALGIDCEYVKWDMQKK